MKLRVKLEGQSLAKLVNEKQDPNATAELNTTN
jgi:hypothetical protein